MDDFLTVTRVQAQHTYEITAREHGNILSEMARGNLVNMTQTLVNTGEMEEGEREKSGKNGRCRERPGKLQSAYILANVTFLIIPSHDFISLSAMLLPGLKSSI